MKRVLLICAVASSLCVGCSTPAIGSYGGEGMPDGGSLPPDAGSAAKRDCTDGVDCYCDRVGDLSGPFYDPDSILCEDFEDAAFHEDVPGAWYASHESIPNFRGGGSLWLQRYRSSGNGGLWVGGEPANPKVGETCANGEICGPAEWRFDDLWDGNAIASIDVQRTDEWDDEIAGLTLDGVFDGKQHMAWRIAPGRTTGIHGNVVISPPATEIGLTQAIGYSTNLLSANGESGDFPRAPWKHTQWGETRSAFFMGNVGIGGAPFSPALFGNAGSQQACRDLVAQANIEVGDVDCNDLAGVMIGSDFERTRDWPLGTWGCVRGHIKGMGTNNGSMKIWFNDRLIFSMTNANLAGLFKDQSVGSMDWNSYYNGNQRTPPRGQETFYRYTDNVHVRRGEPVSCEQIGLTQ